MVSRSMWFYIRNIIIATLRYSHTYTDTQIYTIPVGVTDGAVIIWTSLEFYNKVNNFKIFYGHSYLFFFSVFGFSVSYEGHRELNTCYCHIYCRIWDIFQELSGSWSGLNSGNQKHRILTQWKYKQHHPQICWQANWN